MLAIPHLRPRIESLSLKFPLVGANLPLLASHFPTVLHLVKDECLHPPISPGCSGALPEALHPRGRGGEREGERGNITGGVRDKYAHTTVISL